MTILERPLYGRIAIETSPWASTFTWTDRTSTLVNGIQYSEGGRIGTPGTSQVDVGTLTATFKDASTVPVVGDLVRLKRYGTSEYFWVGYVQDVSQRIVFGNRSSNTAPFVMTTIYCNDWVGYISQFQAVGVGGANTSTGALITTSDYNWRERIAALNLTIDPTYATLLINTINGSGTFYSMGDTDLADTFSAHLDLITCYQDLFWYGTHNLPTNKTTGRSSLVTVVNANSLTSSSKTFTDVAGSAGQLHYTEIDFENSTQNIANNLIVSNRTRINVADSEVTKIGGFNENNYLVINNTNVVGVPAEWQWKVSDSTSITNYGNRQTEIQANNSFTPVFVNLLANPSAEYSDDGYFGDSTTVTRRRKPSEDANPFAANNGSWAIRSRMKGITNTTPVIGYTGTESDGTPVVAGTTYYFYAWAARGIPNRADVRARARIKWYDADEAVISTVYGAQTTMVQNVWTQCASGAQVAPAGAVRAQVAVEFNRSGGGNFSAGDVNWADSFLLSKAAAISIYFDGDSPTTATNIFQWSGGVGSSPSYLAINYLDNISSALLSKYSTTSMRVSRIRWNAQEDLTAVSSLVIGSTISLVYKSTTTTYRIVGIDGTVDPDRYMIDYYLAKV
jgi:hypothetical protein